MLRYDLKRVMRARGKSRFFHFLRQHGFGSNTASRLLNAHVRNINVTQVERLCLLFDCTPNDLLEWEPDSDISSPEKKALAQLIRKDKVDQVNALLYQVPMSKLNDVAQYLKSQIEEEDKL